MDAREDCKIGGNQPENGGATYWRYDDTGVKLDHQELTQRGDKVGQAVVSDSFKLGVPTSKRMGVVKCQPAVGVISLIITDQLRRLPHIIYLIFGGSPPETSDTSGRER